MKTRFHPRHITLFTLLLVGFVGLFLGIQDLKHPVVRHDSCRLVGQGRSLQSFRPSAEVLYTRSGQVENDIGLSCKALGNVIINDTLPLPLKQGQQISVMTKTFRYIPSRYYFSMPVVNPDEQEKATFHEAAS